MVAARVRRPGPLRPRRDPAAPTTGCWTPGGAGSASARCGWTPHRTATARRSPWWSTTCRSSSAASTGSPTTSSSPGSPASGYAERLAQACDGERQLPARLGRRPVRVGGLLRPRRRARACWSARTSCSPARPTRRRSRSPREVAAEAREQVVRLASHPSLVLWTGNNENIWGYARLGLAGAAGRTQLGRRLLLRRAARASSPSWTRPGRTGRAAPTPGAATCTRTSRRTAPCTSGTCGTPTTTPGTATTAAVRRRVRLPGTARVRHAARAPSPTIRSAPTRRGCGITRRRSTATRSCNAASTPTCRCRATSTTGTT